MSTPTDTERLDWLEKQCASLPWVARHSSTGRGYRVHNTYPNMPGLPPTYPTAREAIDAEIAKEASIPALK